jgi:hypothetical protein
MIDMEQIGMEVLQIDMEEGEDTVIDMEEAEATVIDMEALEAQTDLEVLKRDMANRTCMMIVLFLNLNGSSL